MKKTALNPDGKSLLLSFKIVWNEGAINLAGTTFFNWKDTQYAFNTLYNDMIQAGERISKVGIEVIWNNGKSISLRMELVEKRGGYCPRRQDIGEYLQGICESFPVYMDNDTSDISFEDVELYRPKCQPIIAPVEYSDIHVFPDGSLIKEKHH